MAWHCVNNTIWIWKRYSNILVRDSRHLKNGQFESITQASGTRIVTIIPSINSKNFIVSFFNSMSMGQIPTLWLKKALLVGKSIARSDLLQWSTVVCVGMVNNLLDRDMAVALCCSRLSEEVCVAKHPSRPSSIPMTKRSMGVACSCWTAVLPVPVSSLAAVTLELLSFDRLLLPDTLAAAAPENSSYKVL